MFFRVLGFPDSSDSKDSIHNAGDLGSIPGLGRSPGEGKGYPLQYSGLENSMVCIVHGVAKSRTRLNEFHFRVQGAFSLQSQHPTWKKVFDSVSSLVHYSVFASWVFPSVIEI